MRQTGSMAAGIGPPGAAPVPGRLCRRQPRRPGRRIRTTGIPATGIPMTRIPM